MNQPWDTIAYLTTIHVMWKFSHTEVITSYGLRSEAEWDT